MATRCLPKHVLRHRRIVVFQRVPVRDFVVIADIERRNAIRGFLDAISVTVVNVSCRVSTDRDAGQTIFFIIGKRIAVRAARGCSIAARHVAIRIPSILRDKLHKNIVNQSARRRVCARDWCIDR